MNVVSTPYALIVMAPGVAGRVPTFEQLPAAFVKSAKARRATWWSSGSPSTSSRSRS